jgi:hypothetical protein
VSAIAATTDWPGLGRVELLAGYFAADASWVAPWDGLTALDAARRGGHLELVRWLESIGAASAGVH